MSIVYQKAGLLLVKTLLSSDPTRLIAKWGKVNAEA